MSAKEMFKKLGYSCDGSCDGILYFKDLDDYEDREVQIDFDKQCKTFNIWCKKIGFSGETYLYDVSMEELQAINKQIEELGWKVGSDNE